MTVARIIDGKLLARSVRDRIRFSVTQGHMTPCLAAILVGDDPASHVYVKHKINACAEVGIKSTLYTMPQDSTQDEICNVIQCLNKDMAVHGILLQLPLPDGLDESVILQHIAPEKDVDGLTYLNIGRLTSGSPCMVPCTPQGVMELIRTVHRDLTGLHAVVIGRSLLFGKPMAQLLLQADCTVTHTHSKTVDLPSLTKQADILIVATGRASMVKADWVKPGATVIDVGINRQPDNSLKGDVDFDAVSKIAGAITPVPGGVGPMTVACLLRNTLKAATNN